MDTQPKHIPQWPKVLQKLFFSVYESHKQLFEQEGLLLFCEDVEKEYCAVIYDFHTVGVVALHQGRPLEDFSCMETTVFDQPVSLKRSQVDTYKKCLQNLVTRLCPPACYCKATPVELNYNKQESLPIPGPQPAPPPQFYQGNGGLHMGPAPPPPQPPPYFNQGWVPPPPPPPPPLPPFNLLTSFPIPVDPTILDLPTYNNGMGGFYLL